MYRSRTTLSRFAGRTRSESAKHVLAKVTEAKAHGYQWKRLYRTRVVLVDAAAVVAAVTLAEIGRFWPLEEGRAGGGWWFVTAYSCALALIWLIALGVQQSWDFSLAGVGSEEYRRVVKATAWVFGLIASTALLFQQYMARGYLAIALPVGLVGLVGGRYLLRRSLAKKRLNGEFTSHVVVLGKPASIVALCQSLNRAKSAGYKVIGACVPDFDGDIGPELETATGPVPVLGDEDAVEHALRLTNASILAVTASEHLGHERMRALAWRLDALKVDLLVMPGMTDIAGPRLRIRPIDNLPLFHIARPRHDGPSRHQKRVFDLVFGSIALITLLPVMVVAACAIKLDDGGPVFFRQHRVGYGGKLFRIFKFRTMIDDSDEMKNVEQAASGQADTIFYKSASDSRVTRVGRFLRRTSIDEIPQFFNVVTGSMSIVGPRPLVPGEGGTVEYFIERRALVKPGMTGLWQVSGRSDVSAEERIRLDHSYVDNWSSVQDLVIVWRTVKTVLNRQGAY